MKKSEKIVDFEANCGFFSSGFMSPQPQSEQIQNNPIALQLRGSQANLQQALRLHEDLSRQVMLISSKNANH